MRFFVFPYTQNSAGAIGLAGELDGKRILRQGSNYTQKDDDIVINWGDGECSKRFPKALNANVMDLINKVAFFKRLDGTGLTPAFSLGKATAHLLGYPVFCRTTVEGQDGAGIVIADKEEELTNAQLYVKGIDKTSEYRVHVGRYPDGELVIIGGNQKFKKTDAPSTKDTRIWTGDGTYLGDFIRENDENFPKDVLRVALATMRVFKELTFVGLDIIYDNSEAKAYVIEGNSAPMMTAMTVYYYGLFFKEYPNRLKLVAPQVVVPAAPVVAESPAMTVEAAMKVPLTELIECYIKNN